MRVGIWVRGRPAEPPSSLIVSTCSHVAPPPLPTSYACGRRIHCCPCAGMHEMVGPLTNALPHLQPPKRLRGKAAEEAKAMNPPRRRRCRVSDEEFARNQLSRGVGSRMAMGPLFDMGHEK